MENGEEEGGGKGRDRRKKRKERIKGTEMGTVKESNGRAGKKA